jgi:hypothetical protein
MNLSPQVSQFFGAAALFKLLDDAQSVKNNIPMPLPAAAYQESMSNRPVGTQVTYYRKTGNRSSARSIAPGSPSRAIEKLPGSSLITETGLVAAEHWSVSPDMIYGLNTGQPWFVERATNEINRNAANARNRLEFFKADQIHSAFAKGAIWTDGDGKILDSASGATNTIDFGVPTGNKLTTGGAGSTYAIGNWSSASTDLGTAVRKLRQAAIKASGYDLNTVYYGVNIPRYLAENTTLAKYSYASSLNEAVANKNEIPSGVLGLNWVPVYQAFSGSTGSQWFDDNFIAFAPGIGADWYELIPLGQVVPSVGVADGLVTGGSNDAASAAAVTVQYGMYSYAYHKTDPYQLRIVNGAGYMPVIKAPTGYYFGQCG